MVNELAAKPRCRTEETIHGWPATTKVGTVIKKDCETFGSQEYIPEISIVSNKTIGVNNKNVVIDTTINA